MAKALFIVAPTDFKDEEYFKPKNVLEKGGVRVITCSTINQPVSVNGQKIKSDLLLKDATSNYDAIVFIGGPGASVYFNDEKAHELAKEFYEQGKVVAAICIAPSTLANARILEGKSATAFSSEEGNLEAKGATCTGAGVEVDENIITADGPSASTEFGNRILEALG